jgi:hypothetical protein
MKTYRVYILAGDKNGTLYIGVTNWKDLHYDYGGEEYDANMDYNSMKNILLDSRSSRE